MDSIKELFAQANEYTLMIKKIDEYQVQLLHDMSQHILHNLSETATFEIIKDKKRTITTTDITTLPQTIYNEILNIRYIEANDMNIPEKTLDIKHFHEYGELISVQEAEKINTEILEFLKGYKEFLSAEIDCIIKEIKEYTYNSYDLEIMTHRKFACIEIAIIGEGKQKVICFYYMKLPNSLDMIKKKLKIEMEENMPLRVNAEDIQSGKYNILFSNELSAEIIENIVHLTEAGVIKLDGCMKERIGTQIISEKVNIIEDPISQNYQKHFDMYGEKVERKYIVKNGILQTYLVGRRNARIISHKTTANSFYFSEDFVNIYVESTAHFEQNINGIFVDKFLSMDINESTAEMSVAISGFLLKNGKKVNALTNGVLNINLLQLIDIEIFDNIYDEGRVFCGSIFMRDIIINGQ